MTFKTLFLFVSSIICASSEVIKTIQTQQYKWKEIHCIESEDCTIICDQDESCAGSTIYCPITSDCHTVCNATAACASATIVWSLDETINSTLTCDGVSACTKTSRPLIHAPNDHEPFYLDCDEFYECYDAVITCPLYSECHITCDYHSCSHATFIWPQQHPYSLTCNSHHSSCKDIVYTPYNNNQDLILNADAQEMFALSTIYCPSDASCTIHCDEWGACGYSSEYSSEYYLPIGRTTIHCPDSNPIHDCNITCRGTYACRNAIINGNGILSICNGDGSCEEAIFPNPPSNETYVLECNGESSCEGAVIQCPDQADCHISCNSKYSCKNAMIIWPTVTDTNSTLFCNPLFTDVCDSVNVPYTVNIYSDTESTDLYINCGNEAECSGHIIHCPLNAGCFITCSGAYSCNGLLVHWIEDAPHSLECADAIGSCRGTLVIPSADDQDFTFKCAEKMCAFATIQCPKNASCNIECYDSSSCYGAIIKGGMDTPLFLDCYGINSCKKARVYAQNTSSCVLHGCGASGSCRYIAIWFPAKKDGEIKAVIDATPSTVYSLNDVAFYAIHGWMDIQINIDYTLYDNQYPVHHYGKMHCSSDYSIICNLFSNFSCNPYGIATCNGSDDVVSYSTIIPTDTATSAVTETDTMPTTIVSLTTITPTDTATAAVTETGTMPTTVVSLTTNRMSSTVTTAPTRVFNISLIAITTNDNLTTIKKYVEDRIIYILSVENDYYPVGVGVIVNGKDTEERLSISVIISLETTSINQYEIEQDIDRGLDDESNGDIHIEVYVIFTEYIPSTSSHLKEFEDDPDDLWDYLNVPDMNTTQWIIGICIICGIVALCCCIPLILCCFNLYHRGYRHGKNKTEDNQDVGSANEMEEHHQELNKDKSLSLPNLPSEKSNPQDRKGNENQNRMDLENTVSDKQIEGKHRGNKLKLYAKDSVLSDAMYEPYHTATTAYIK